MAQKDQTIWLAEANVARFRKLLTSPKDEFQRKQLEELLACELERLEALSQDESAREQADPRTNTSPDQSELPGKPAT